MPTFHRKQTFPEAIGALDTRITRLNRRVNQYQLKPNLPADSITQVVPGLHTSDMSWTNQRVYFARFVPSEAYTLRYIRPVVTTAGSATNSTFRIGVYDAQGVSLSTTSDLVQATNVVGAVPLSLTTTVDLNAGTAYYAAVLVITQSGTPKFASQSQFGTFWNLNQYTTTSGTLRDVMVQGSRTSMPSSMSGATTYSSTTAVDAPLFILY